MNAHGTQPRVQVRPSLTHSTPTVFQNSHAGRSLPIPGDMPVRPATARPWIKDDCIATATAQLEIVWPWIEWRTTGNTMPPLGLHLPPSAVHSPRCNDNLCRVLIILKGSRHDGVHFHVWIRSQNGSYTSTTTHVLTSFFCFFGPAFFITTQWKPLSKCMKLFSHPRLQGGEICASTKAPGALGHYFANSVSEQV